MSGTVALEISIEADGWNRITNIEQLCSHAIEHAKNLAEPKPLSGAELSVMLTSDAEVRALNKKWRGQDKTTNILSFPAVPANKIARSPILGDLALGYETVAAEAENENKTFEHHMMHLVIHGFLHILGYDHGNEAEATIMETLETRILAKMGISDPYADSDLLTPNLRSI